MASHILHINEHILLIILKNIEMQAQIAFCGYIGNKERGWNKEIETKNKPSDYVEKNLLNSTLTSSYLVNNYSVFYSL